MACRKRGHPSGWIRREKRLRLYQRDRFTCVYCAQPYPRQELTIDHVHSRNNGGHNHTRNLVTACRSCNSSRQDQDLWVWCLKKGLDYARIKANIRNAIRRKLPELLPGADDSAGREGLGRDRTLRDVQLPDAQEEGCDHVPELP